MTAPDHAADGSARQESKAERLTRNLNELLQELRVTQTGVQILTGFLLTVPFTDRFTDLDLVQRRGFLVVLSLTVLATAFLVAPVSFHRMLFRGGRREWVVAWAHRCARVGLALLAAATTGVVWLVFDVVSTRPAAVLAAAVALASFAALWWLLPVTAGRRTGRRTDA